MQLEDRIDISMCSVQTALEILSEHVPELAGVPDGFTERFGVYQSLHTTVIAEGGSTLEVQVRTHEMHYNAEFGVHSVGKVHRR